MSRLLKYFAALNDIGQNEVVTRKLVQWIYEQHLSPEIILPNVSKFTIRPLLRF